MTQTFSPNSALLSAEQLSAEPRAGQGGSEIAQASLALLTELEASLQASQQGLLSCDVARVERSTREQIRLCRALGILWSGNAGASGMQCDLALAAELRSAQRRVLHLGRVQAALLRRAQRWLRMLSNLTAGPEAGYLPPSGMATALFPEWPPSCGGKKEIGPCRA